MRTRPGPVVYNPPGTPGPGQSMWDPSITSLADLAAVSTINLPFGAIRAWIMAADGTEQVWRLLYGVEATSDGVQRPTDWNSVTNPKVWFKSST